MPSAKRYGLDVKNDLELELRLRRIEAKLDQLAPANQDATATTANRSSVPQVTGLRVTGRTPGAVTVAWNPVAIPDLRRYEIKIAEDFSFQTNVQSVNEAGTQYQISTVSATGGSGGTTLYVKVRAVNNIGQTGAYSTTLNTSTGQAQTEDIQDGAVTGEKVDTTTSVGSLTFDELVAQLVETEGLLGHLSGLTLSRPSASTITVAIGSTTRLTTQVSASITKSISSTWVAGTGNGGLGTGAVAADTSYHVFLIKSSDGVYDVGFDTSLSAANLLTTSGYTKYRRLGSIRTSSGSTDIEDFVQTDEYFKLVEPRLVDNSTRINTTAVLIDVKTPAGIKVDAKIIVRHHKISANSGLYVSDPDTDDRDVLNTAGNNDNATIPAYDSSNIVPQIPTHTGGSGGDGPNAAELQITTNTSSQLRFKSGSTDTANDRNKISLYLVGWVDRGLRGAVASDS